MVEHKVVELVENSADLTHCWHLGENEDIFSLKTIRADWCHCKVNSDFIKREGFLIEKFKRFNNCRSGFVPIKLQVVDRVIN